MQPSTDGLTENPQSPYCTDVLLEDGLATTTKLPAIRPQSMQQTSLTPQRQIVPVSEECTSNNGGKVE